MLSRPDDLGPCLNPVPDPEPDPNLRCHGSEPSSGATPVSLEFICLVFAGPLPVVAAVKRYCLQRQELESMPSCSSKQLLQQQEA